MSALDIKQKEPGLQWNYKFLYLLTFILAFWGHKTYTGYSDRQTCYARKRINLQLPEVRSNILLNLLNIWIDLLHEILELGEESCCLLLQSTLRELWRWQQKVSPTFRKLYASTHDVMTQNTCVFNGIPKCDNYTVVCVVLLLSLVTVITVPHIRNTTEIRRKISSWMWIHNLVGTDRRLREKYCFHLQGMKMTVGNLGKGFFHWLTDVFDTSYPLCILGTAFPAWLTSTLTKEALITPKVW